MDPSLSLPDARAAVLVAEHDPAMRGRLGDVLTAGGWEARLVADGDAAFDAIAAPDGPGIAVLGHTRPGGDGRELCRRIRAARHDRYTFLVVLTPRDDEAEILSILEAGADDALVVPSALVQLPMRLRVARRIVSIYDELLSARDALRHRALHDGLTGVLNRTGILEALQAEAAASRRGQGPIGLAMLDLDRFKCVNDTWGHAAGDAVLREVTVRLRAHLRPYDRIGRLGGEEFLLVLPRCDAAGLRTVAERVRTAVSREPVRFEGHAIAVTCSVGIACVGDPGDAVAHVRLADAALYLAKRTGRDRVVALPEHVGADLGTPSSAPDS